MTTTQIEKEILAMVRVGIRLDSQIRFEFKWNHSLAANGRVTLRRIDNALDRLIESGSIRQSIELGDVSFWLPQQS